MPDQPFTQNLLRNRTSELSAAHREAIEAGISEVRLVAAGQVIVPQGKKMSTSTLLVEGFITRNYDAPDGTGHLVAVHVPGDFVDLHAWPLKHMDHDVAALTDVTIAVVPHPALDKMVEASAELARRLWFMTLLDAAIHRQWVYRLSSLTAIERVAHFLCEINARLLAIGASDGCMFELPMNQAQVGEVCSLTNVHVSRVLGRLRDMGLCSLKSSLVEIHDLRTLAQTGRFSPEYLYLNDRTAAQALGSQRRKPA